MRYEELIGFKSNARVRVLLESIAYYPFHLHKGCIEIICVLNGSVIISDSALDHVLSYGDVYIFNVNDPHKIVSEDPESIVLTVQIDRTSYDRFFENLQNAYFICNTFSGDGIYPTEIKYLRFLLARLFTQYYLSDAGDLEIEETTKELLKHLLDQFQFYTYRRAENGPPDIVLRQNMKQSYKRIYRIIDFITVHYKEKLTLEKIAAMEYLSVPHLSRCIKEASGLTFSELLSLTRCEEAVRLLSSTNKTVDQIAEEVGFANRKHLSAQFQRWFSRKPSEYRRSIVADLNSSSRIRLRPFDFDFAKKIIEMYLNGY